MDKKSILLAITGLFIFLTAFAQRSEDRKEYIEKSILFSFPRVVLKSSMITKGMVTLSRP